MPIPSQCPECGAIAVEISDVPPSNHDHGDAWRTRVECGACDEFAEWERALA